MGSSSVFSLLRPTKVEARRSFLRICLYNMCISLVFFINKLTVKPRTLLLVHNKGRKESENSTDLYDVIYE